MKQMIVFIAMVILGCSIYQIIMGGDNSIYRAVTGIWQQELAAGSVQYR